MNALITTTEAAGLLNVTPQTVRNYVHARLLVPVVTGTGTAGFIFDRREVEALAEKRQK